MQIIEPISPSPELSIVVPVFNGIEFLQDTLESLAKLEEILSCELIFQNCRSTDGTTERLDTFCRQRTTRFHFNEQDSGQSDAINTGMKRAHGHWVTWLCADDILLPTVKQALDEANTAGVDLVYGDVVFVSINISFPAIGTEKHFPGALAKRRLIIQQPGTCILRTAWQEVNGVNVNLNWSMDYDLFMRLESRDKKLLRVDRFLAIIRIHPDAKTSSGSIWRVFELWAVLWQNHYRRLKYFRMRPYLVYGVEFIIKTIESKRNLVDSFLVKKLLIALHKLFWKITVPLERHVIEHRFHNLSDYDKKFLMKLTKGSS